MFPSFTLSGALSRSGQRFLILFYGCIAFHCRGVSHREPGCLLPVDFRIIEFESCEVLEKPHVPTPSLTEKETEAQSSEHSQVLRELETVPGFLTTPLNQIRIISSGEVRLAAAT